VIVVAETNLAEADAPLQTADAPFTNGAVALAVKVIVSVPTGSGFGVSAVSVGPGPSGFTYTIAEIFGLAVAVAVTRTEFFGSVVGAVYSPDCVIEPPPVVTLHVTVCGDNPATVAVYC
jgi:hypothetical protein